MLNALTNGAKEVNAKFKDLKPTIADIKTILANTWTEFLRQFGKASGIRDNIQTITNSILDMGVAFVQTSVSMIQAYTEVEKIFTKTRKGFSDFMQQAQDFFRDKQWDDKIAPFAVEAMKQVEKEMQQNHENEIKRLDERIAGLDLLKKTIGETIVKTKEQVKTFGESTNIVKVNKEVTLSFFDQLANSIGKVTTELPDMTNLTD